MDKDFLEKFKMELEHNARAWEFYLAVVLIETGAELKEKDWEYGPDFCINTRHDKNIWIEAVTCERGLSDVVEPYPEMIPDQIYLHGGDIESINRPRVLRITNVFVNKFKKFENYMENSGKSNVTTKDCLVIAINGKAIQHHSNPQMLFKRTVFAQGNDVYKRNAGKKLEGPYYKPQEYVVKKTQGKDINISSNLMELDEFSKISAVLYCGNGIADSFANQYELGSNFLIAHHVNPINPLPKDTFKFGRGIWKNKETGEIFEKDLKGLFE